MTPAGGLLGAAWFAGLWIAAPLLGNAGGLADRLRNALIAGICIPFALGILGCLHPAACWVALCLLCVLRLALVPLAFRTEEPDGGGAGTIALAIAFAGVAFAAWPALVRPPMDGDTLSYHLPNAAAWAHAGSVWNTDTRYWWYPGGSELFAAAMIAAGALPVVGAAGSAAVALLVARIVVWQLEAGVPSVVAGLVGAATATAHVVAVQSGNLENDAWLAAFVLEIVWLGTRRDTRGTTLAAAAGGLVKPFGAVLAAIAALFARPRPAALLAMLPLAAWIVRDLALAPQATIPIASTAFPNLAQTTIASHGFAGLSTLATALRADGPWTLALAAGAFAAPFAGLGTSLALTAPASAVLFLLLPFGFANAQPQLATGASLRYLLPGLACGAVALAPLAKRFPVPVLLFAAFAVWSGTQRIADAFRNDASTHGVSLVAFFVLVAVLGAGRLWPPLRAPLLGACAAVLLSIAGVRAAGHPLGYLDDWLAGPGRTTRVFDAISVLRPPAIVTVGVGSGAIAIAAPQTRIVDGLDGNERDQATRAGAWLLIELGDPRRAAVARAAARAGTVRYADATALLVEPAPRAAR